jgi:hypothetical protein
VNRPQARALPWWPVDQADEAASDRPDPWTDFEEPAVALSDDQRRFLAGDVDQPPPPLLRDRTTSAAAHGEAAGDATGDPPGDGVVARPYGRQP